jgi:hypothetical protein
VDDSAEIADRAHALYTDSELWQAAQSHLLEVTATRFDRETFRTTLVEAMSELGVAPPPGSFSRPDPSRPRLSTSELELTGV